MATIVLSSYMVRHPLGGVMASNLQLVWGLSRLGHEVFVLETAGYPNSCFDPVRHRSGDDCTYGVQAVQEVLADAGLRDRLSFVDATGRHHGLQQSEVARVLGRCDLFVDRGDHRVYADDLPPSCLRVLVDPDPGYRQIKLDNARRAGEAVPVYDRYYTYGFHLAAGTSPAPAVGVTWHHLLHPVDTRRITAVPPVPDGPFTTVMNWTSHKPVAYAGETYGMKDVEFEAFIDLPSRTTAPLEVAVEGKGVPVDRLRAEGWRVVEATVVTATLASYLAYIRGSAGEFSVLKEVYRALRVGWFSDRSAVYLATGRPVVVQDNGLHDVLPTGVGLFSVDTPDEAAAAIDEVRSNPDRHARAARELAVAYLDTETVLGGFLTELGLPATAERR